MLSGVHREEWREIRQVLEGFRLPKSAILAGGGRKTEKIAGAIDSEFYRMGWAEKSFDTKITVDEVVYPSPTHSVDCYKNKVAIEVEWNNKDTFYDRDLNNFRLLFELRALDVGVIITRSDELNDIFRSLVKAGRISKNKYVDSTTHMGKLLPRLEGGGGGGCPVLVFGITKALYVEDVP